jgi:hypothetical protein
VESHPLGALVRSLLPSLKAYGVTNEDITAQLARFSRYRAGGDLLDIGPRESEFLNTMHIGVSAVPDNEINSGSNISDIDAEKDAWSKAEQQYNTAEAQGEQGAAGIPDSLERLIGFKNEKENGSSQQKENGYKYLPKRLAVQVLDYLRLYHRFIANSLPYTLMSLHADLSYYREFTENGKTVTKIIFFSKSDSSIIEITEFFFVDGKYYAYGHARLTSRDQVQKKLDTLQLLFGVLPESRGDPYLSRMIFKERMKEFAALLPEDGRFEIESNQIDKVPAALPFYLGMGFTPEEQVLEEETGSKDKQETGYLKFIVRKLVSSLFPARPFYIGMGLKPENALEESTGREGGKRVGPLKFSMLKLFTDIYSTSLELSVKDFKEANPDVAMAGEKRNEGGIDLTSHKFLQTQNAGEDIKFYLDPAMLAELQNASGFEPVIINIQPVANLRVFLGLADS